MKYLLTSGGVSNPTIHHALVQLLGKPISECNALCIPTAVYPMKEGAQYAMEFLEGKSGAPMCELGWKQLGVLELTALPSLDQKIWISWLENTDVILVNGGDPSFLAYWLRKSGVDQILPHLNAVYVGMSAGSMVMTPNIGHEFVEWVSKEGNDQPLGLVPFSIFPHLGHPMLPDNNIEAANKWAKALRNEAYAMDDATAIEVVGPKISVLSEGKWVKFDF